MWITLGFSGGFDSNGVRTITTQRSDSGSSFTVDVHYTSGSLINMIFERATKEDVVSMHRQMSAATGLPSKNKVPLAEKKQSAATTTPAPVAEKYIAPIGV